MNSARHEDIVGGSVNASSKPWFTPLTYYCPGRVFRKHSPELSLAPSLATRNLDGLQTYSSDSGQVAMGQRGMGYSHRAFPTGRRRLSRRMWLIRGRPVALNWLSPAGPPLRSDRVVGPPDRVSRPGRLSSAHPPPPPAARSRWLHCPSGRGDRGLAPATLLPGPGPHAGPPDAVGFSHRPSPTHVKTLRPASSPPTPTGPLVAPAAGASRPPHPASGDRPSSPASAPGLPTPGAYPLTRLSRTTVQWNN